MGNVPRNKNFRRVLGDLGESIACQWYLDHGYEIVDRNVNIAHIGEIDVIASRKNEMKVEFVFSEVKTRSTSFAGQGYEAITYAKRLKMRNCAMAWIGENIDLSKQRIRWRIDVVSIDTSKARPVVRVFENIEV